MWILDDMKSSYETYAVQSWKWCRSGLTVVLIQAWSHHIHHIQTVSLEETRPHAGWWHKNTLPALTLSHSIAIQTVSQWAHTLFNTFRQRVTLFMSSFKQKNFSCCRICLTIFVSFNRLYSYFTYSGSSSVNSLLCVFPLRKTHIVWLNKL